MVLCVIIFRLWFDSEIYIVDFYSKFYSWVYSFEEMEQEQLTVYLLPSNIFTSSCTDEVRVEPNDIQVHTYIYFVLHRVVFIQKLFFFFPKFPQYILRCRMLLYFHP
jgi:hypothetical protein